MGLKDVHILKKYQTRLFLLFFGAASFVWLLNSLNESYTKDVVFKLAYINLDPDFRIHESSDHTVSLRISSSGFKLFALAFSNLELSLDLSDLSTDASGSFMLPKANQLSQFSNQLGSSITLSGFTPNSPLSFDFYKLVKKRLPLRLQADIRAAPNFFISSIEMQPDSVRVWGSGDQLSGIHEVNSESFRVGLLKSNLDTLIHVTAIDSLTISPARVRLKAEVLSFSEKIFKVSIKAKDLPTSHQVYFFPNQMEVVVAAPIETLKQITESDFELFVPYKQLKDATSEIIQPTIESLHPEIHHLYIKDTIGVEYIITKKI